MLDGAHNGRRRGRYAKSEVTRQLILDAAFDVFANSGFRSGSLRDVATAAGMSQAGLLHHFPSKPALLIAVLERRDDHARTLLQREPGTARAALRQLVALARYNATLPGVIKLYCTLSGEATASDHPAYPYFEDHYETARVAMTGVLHRAQQAGALRPGIDVPGAATRSIALWDGLQIQWLHDRSGVDMADELQSHFNLLLVYPLSEDDDARARQ